MTDQILELDLDAALARARAMAAGPRRLLGIVGPPGAGKSTLAELIVRELGAAAVLVPMDGFHLADVQLRRLGRLDRKGAPDTFDADGYVALLERLRAPQTSTVYAPAFERTFEQPVAGAVDVGPDVPLVVTEGNYLLLDEPGWRGVPGLLDEVWWVDSEPGVRHERLVARHVRFGKTPTAAADWVDSVDEVNARLLAAGRDRADVVVSALPPLPSGGPVGGA